MSCRNPSCPHPDDRERTYEELARRCGTQCREIQSLKRVTNNQYDRIRELLREKREQNQRDFEQRKKSFNEPVVTKITYQTVDDGYSKGLERCLVEQAAQIKQLEETLAIVRRGEDDLLTETRALRRIAEMAKEHLDATTIMPALTTRAALTDLLLKAGLK